MLSSHPIFGLCFFRLFVLSYVLVQHINGQTERVNQTIEDILRAYCSREHSQWIQYLPLVEYVSNLSYHQSIGMTPFNALYGQECLSPLNFSDPNIRVEASKRMIEEMTEQTKAIRKDIQAAQDDQKHYADL